MNAFEKLFKKYYIQDKEHLKIVLEQITSEKFMSLLNKPKERVIKNLVIVSHKLWIDSGQMGEYNSMTQGDSILSGMRSAYGAILKQYKYNLKVLGDYLEILSEPILSITRENDPKFIREKEKAEKKNRKLLLELITYCLLPEISKLKTSKNSRDYLVDRLYVIGVKEKLSNEEALIVLENKLKEERR